MNINIIDVLLLPMVFFVGLMTSIEDNRISKIRNKWILYGLIYGLLVFFGFALWDLVREPVSHYYYTHIAGIGLNDPRPIFTVHYNIFLDTAINSALALLLGFVLWRYNVIAAGDAKLFFVYVLLVPTKYYWKSYLPFFPGIAILINTFIVVLLYFVMRAGIYSLYRLFLRIIGATSVKIPKKKTKTPRNEKIKQYRGMIGILFGFTSVFLLFFYLVAISNKYLGINLGGLQAPVFIVLIIFSRVMAKKIFSSGRNLIIVTLLFILLATGGLIFNFLETLSVLTRVIKMMAIFIAAMTIMSKIIDFYFDETGTRLIKTEKLQAGMILGREHKSELEHDKVFSKENIEKIKGSCLTGEQAAAVVGWARGRGIKLLKIDKKFSFALWMFISVIITLLIKGSVVNFVLELVKAVAGRQ